MYNLLKIEFIKLKKSKEFRFIFLGICLISIGLLSNKIYSMEVFIRKTDPGFAFTGLEFFREMIRGKMYIEVIQNILLIIFICNDFEKRIVHSEELAGYSRFQILISKFIICFVIKLILTFFFLFIGSVVLGILYGVGQEFNISLVFKVIRMYLLSVLISFGISTVAIMISYIFKIISVSAIVWIGVFFGYLSGCTVVEDVFKIPQSLQYFLDNSIFTFYKKLQLDMMFGDIEYIITMTLLRIVIVFSITYIVFRKTELK